MQAPRCVVPVGVWRLGCGSKVLALEGMHAHVMLGVKDHEIAECLCHPISMELLRVRRAEWDVGEVSRAFEDVRW
jgi:hypothetical protein